jgi:hypothetical protein
VLGKERGGSEYKPKSLEGMPLGCWLWVGCMVMIAVWLARRFF